MSSRLGLRRLPPLPLRLSLSHHRPHHPRRPPPPLLPPPAPSAHLTSPPPPPPPSFPRAFTRTRTRTRTRTSIPQPAPPRHAGPSSSASFSTASSTRNAGGGDDDAPSPLPKGSPMAPMPAVPSFSLQERVIVISGGARGLGLAMAWGVLWAGADVALIDIDYEAARHAAHLLTDQYRQQAGPRTAPPPTVSAHHADVSSPASVDAALASVLGAHRGTVDGLITSAGVHESRAAVAYPPERMRALWGVNVDGSFLCAVALARHLMARRAPGSVVLVGSMSGAVVNVPQLQTPYNVSKAAVRHMAASLAVEWAAHGIRVNCLSPGYMVTALTQTILDANPGLGEDWARLTPQRRLGRPEFLIGPVTFLLSEASAFVTGVDLRVDGGYTLI
ncbi:MAG: hypothetical protein M1826_001036 [Phylliscum demangeonii]|nr:MAG: hypothetical protein M1826_001036 [Phylliscum demangeonii]